MRKFLFILIAAMVLVGCDKDDEVTTYTVIFDSTGGTPTPQSQNVKSGEYINVPTNPTRQGYVFLFWHLEGTSSAYNFQTPVYSNITLQAKWEDAAVAEYWHVSWELDGGTWPSDDNHTTQIVKGGTLAEPNAPVKTGKTFDGWYKNETLTNKINFPYNVNDVTADIILYAKWVDPETEYWQITWELNGGAWPSSGDNHVTKIEKGSTLAEPTAPTKDNSTFDGWYEEETFTNKVVFPYSVTKDFKLYAKWVTGDPSSRGQGLYIGNSMSPVNLSSSNGSDILEKTLNYIYYTSPTDMDYTLIIGEDINVTSRRINTLQKENVTLTITSNERRTISTSVDLNLIGVSDNAKLILTGNITLKGSRGDDHGQSLLSVSSGGILILEETVVIQGNIGGGVSVMSEGTFLMKGGRIYENINRVNGGGGVSVSSNGIFIMEDGFIYDNHAGDGGGVKVWGGTFIMEGGWIGGNQAIRGTVNGISISGGGNGGGVSLGNNPDAEKKGELIMRGGIIYGSNSAITPNKAIPGSGDALYVISGASAEYGTGAKIIYTPSGSIDSTIQGRN